MALRDFVYEVISSLRVVGKDAKMGDVARLCLKFWMSIASTFLNFISLVNHDGLGRDREDITARWSDSPGS